MADAKLYLIRFPSDSTTSMLCSMQPRTLLPQSLERWFVGLCWLPLSALAALNYSPALAPLFDPAKTPWLDLALFCAFIFLSSFVYASLGLVLLGVALMERVPAGRALIAALIGSSPLWVIWWWLLHMDSRRG